MRGSLLPGEIQGRCFLPSEPKASDKGFLHGKQVMTEAGTPTTNAGLGPPALPAWPGYDQAHRALAHPSPDPRAVPVPARLDLLNLHSHFPNAGRTGSHPPNPQSRDEDR